MEPPPRIGTRLDTKFIKGMGKRDDEFIIILDIDKVFSADEFALAQQMGGEQLPLGPKTSNAASGSGYHPAKLL